MSDNEFLPEPLPGSPLPLFAGWFREARSRAQQPNPDAMVLATVGEDVSPAARVVLCKRVDEQAGYVVFFTNYESRKGRELQSQPRAAAVIHWDSMHRQVRIEGPVIRSPAAESDEYFASRALASRVGAWASAQSQPLASRETLANQVRAIAQKFGVSVDATGGEVPRPPHWGGYRLWIESMELWVEGPGRVHDRAIWKRSLTRQDEFSFAAGNWQTTRLNP
ncbi:pyridoxamine 5'-phosphate oxidase [Povalibacter sp.]|uniref:pyridoxamine 5'-phosphate oxidase n=1 Tax=Povalibacter sp. TaxID=1962978 RepID=UPI002F42312A